MLDAYHQQNNKGYPARLIWNIFSDPYNEKWYCCPLDLKPVTPVKGHTRKRKNNDDTTTDIFVVSHFRLKSENISGGCSYGESDEHRNSKILVASLVENSEIPLTIGQSQIPYSTLKIKDIPQLPYRWNRTEKILDNRRADILFQFAEWHPVLGQGIVFEIQYSSIHDFEKKEREYDWITKGYSITWLFTEHFSECSLTGDKIQIDYPWAIAFAEIMNKLREDTATKLQEANIRIGNLENELKNMVEQHLGKTCRTCSYGTTDSKNSELIACWYNTKWRHGWKAHPERKEQLNKCQHWEESV